MWFRKRRALTALGATLERLSAKRGGIEKSEKRELTAALAAIQSGRYLIAIQILQAMHSSSVSAQGALHP